MAKRAMVSHSRERERPSRSGVSVPPLRAGRPCASTQSRRATHRVTGDRHMPPNVRHEDIERRAYKLYEQRGHEDGRDWDDWLQAERELLGTETEPQDQMVEATAWTARRRRAERQDEFA